MKRTSLFLTIFSLLFLLSCSRNANYNYDSIAAIPKDAIFIIKSDNFQKASDKLDKNRAWKIMGQSDGIKSVITQLSSTNSFLKKNKIDILGDDILLSLHQVGNKHYAYLAIVDAEIIKKEDNSILVKYEKSKKEYDGAVIKEYQFPSSSSNIYGSIYKGLLFFSHNQIIVESSIRQLNTEDNLLINKDFEKLFKSANSKEEFNILVNFDKLKSIEEFNKDGEINFVQNFSTWMEADLSIEDNDISMSGVCSSNSDRIEKFVDIFSNEKAQKVNPEEILPSSTAFSITYSFDSYSRFRENYIKYLRFNNKHAKFKNGFDFFEKNSLKEFSQWIDNEITLASIYSSNSNFKFNDLLFIKLKDADDAFESLNKISTEDKNEFRSFSIKTIKDKNHINYILAPSLINFSNPKYCIIDDYLVVSDKLSNLREVINNYLDGQNLGTYSHIENLKNKLSSKSNILLYFINPSFAQNISKAFPEISSIVKNNLEEIEEYKSGAFQLSFEDNIAFVNLVSGDVDKKIEELKTSWELTFENKLQGNINWFKNHKNNSKDILVQDDKNIIYLISSGGKIIWQKQIDGPIMGKVNQVDFFKNRKIQMVFNTANTIYVLDRNGDNVENWPVKLKNKASAPISVFDYDRNRNYRILIASNGYLSMLDSKAKRVSGFSFDNKNIIIDKVSQHFKVKGKDYIVVSSSNGQIYVLDRRGKIRIPIKEKYVLSDNIFYLNEESTHDKSFIITTTKDGQILRLYFNGNTDLSMREIAEENVIFQKLDSEIVTAIKNKISWKNDKMSELSELDIDEISKININKINEDYLLIASSESDNKIYLINSNMKTYKGFPIYGENFGPVKDYNLDSKFDLPVYFNDKVGILKLYTIN